MSEVEELEAENKRLRASIRGYKGMASARQAVDTASERSFQPILSGHGDLHRVKDYEPVCKDCREPNPFFRGETACTNCGKSLGSIRTASNLENCPHCHEQAEAKPLLKRYVKCDEDEGGCGRPLAATPEEAMELSECPGCGGHKSTWSDAGDW